MTLHPWFIIPHLFTNTNSGGRPTNLKEYSREECVKAPPLHTFAPKHDVFKAFLFLKLGPPGECKDPEQRQ